MKGRPALCLALLLGAVAPRPAAAVHNLVSGNGGSDSLAKPADCAAWGFNGQIGGSVAGIATFDAVAPGLIATGSAERAWAEGRAQETRARIREAHAAGLRLYSGTDLFVLPRAVVAQYRDEICDPHGRIDIHRPKTEELFRALLRETFAHVPELDGIVIRTGEIYLHHFPHHAASGQTNESLRQGNSAILRGPATHIAILNILREEVCERLHKVVLYRTWSFGGESFHENTNYYQAVSDAVAPHSNLIFSIKHQQGDFHQLAPFNPTLTRGRHRQLIEVQSQREAYGKGAHPYYIGQGVIEGWEEYAWMMKPGAARGLRDVVTNALYAGVWTWALGGGLEGPEIGNTLWCDLNTYVVSQFVRDPSRTEPELFEQFARERLRLSAADVTRFRELNLLSAQAVLRGQLTTLGARIDVWWARDHFLEAPDLSDFVRRGLVEQALAEKAEAVRMWVRIEALARQIRFADAGTQAFVETTAAYGRIKYALIEQAWTILFLGRAGAAADAQAAGRLRGAIARYDALWAEWRALAAARPECPTLYRDTGFEGRPGIGAAVERCRAAVAPPVREINE